MSLRTFAAISLVGWLLSATSVLGQGYPKQPINLIIPLAPAMPPTLLGEQ